MKRKDVVAILLAGGQGSRLNPLTKNIAKPALPFGAEYRIIDFALSNCANSGIDTIGVLVQYKPYTDEKMRITEFQEKPKYPKSNLASMGIYLYKWDVLKKYLSNREKDIDFGKHIIPRMIEDNRSVYAYRFEGYWKDIGVIESYWDAQMDLLKDTGKEHLFDKEWPIYSANSIVKPQYMSKKAVIKNSMIGSGALIQGTIINSIIFKNVQIGPNTVVRNSIILPDAEICNNTIIDKSIIGSDSIVRNNVRIGVDQSNNKETGITVIADKSDILEGSLITSGRLVYDVGNFYSDDEVYYA